MRMIGLPPSSAKRGERFDEASLEELFRECLTDVHGYALSLLGDRSSAEDVTALAFERLFRARRRIDPGRGTPRALLFTIVRNAALDELRRRRRQPLVSPAAETLASPPAGDAVEQEDVERRETVRAALASLPPREREIVLLKFHGQLTNAELAHALGISESNAGTRLSRALARLRESSLAEEVA
jgi:RNA polymerase sigma-70 factor, ECF subfamily